MRPTVLAATLCGLLALLPASASAQVFDPGPSDSALFTTVLNLPPDPDLEGGVILGGVPGETTQLNLAAGGSVGPAAAAAFGAEVNVLGGTLGPLFDAVSGSEVNVLDGSVGDDFDAFPGSVVNVFGGTVGEGFLASSGSEVNVFGGGFGSGGVGGSGFEALAGSAVHLVGTEFSLGVVLLDDLPLGEPVVIADRGTSLSGTLADGSPFFFALNTGIDLLNPSADFFSSDATLTVTLVPEPATAGLVLLASGLLALRSVGRRRFSALHF